MRNLTGAARTGAVPISRFATFPVSGGTIYFDLQNVGAGTGKPAACLTNIVGNICTPPKSPFTLTQQGSTGNGTVCDAAVPADDCSVSVTLNLQGVAYFSTSPTVRSFTFGTFTTQVISATIGTVLAAVQTPAGFTTTYSATFMSTAPAPICVIRPAERPLAGLRCRGTSSIRRGPTMWFRISAHIGRPSGVPTTTVTTVNFTGVGFVLNGTTYSLPSGRISFRSIGSDQPHQRPSRSPVTAGSRRSIQLPQRRDFLRWRRHCG